VKAQSCPVSCFLPVRAWPETVVWLLYGFCSNQIDGQSNSYPDKWITPEKTADRVVRRYRGESPVSAFIVRRLKSIYIGIRHEKFGRKLFLSLETSKGLALSWSGGKESSLTLERLRRMGQVVDRLVVTCSEEFDRVTMHGVRRELIQRQSDALGIPLESVFLPRECSNEIYEEKMESVAERLIKEEINQIAFGDIHLQDVRNYRESCLEPTGLSPVFPLWGDSPDQLKAEFFERGFQSRVICGDPNYLKKEQMGCSYRELVNTDGFEDCDSAGEYGEFHTFVWNGPIFSNPIDLEVGNTIIRDGFFYTELYPAS